MIEEIHCYGTSHTEGGGFEFWRNDYYPNILKKFYLEEPFTQFNYSYPGQLQKLLPNNIKVFNHGKCGYGNERMYRLAYDEILNEKNLNKKLFIFEFSYIGRKEFYSNTRKNYFVVNYKFDEKENYIPHGLAVRYNDKKEESIDREVLDKIVLPFMIETTNGFEQYKLLQRNQEFFIDFLLMKGVNFLFFGHPEYSNYSLIENKMISSNKNNDIWSFIDLEKETIYGETNKKMDDPHSGLSGNKKIAKIVFDKIKQKYDIDLNANYIEDTENKLRHKIL